MLADSRNTKGSSSGRKKVSPDDNLIACGKTKNASKGNNVI